jgi:hypothetical protein
MSEIDDFHPDSDLEDNFRRFSLFDSNSAADAAAKSSAELSEEDDESQVLDPDDDDATDATDRDQPSDEEIEALATFGIANGVDGVESLHPEQILILTEELSELSEADRERLEEILSAFGVSGISEENEKVNVHLPIEEENDNEADLEGEIPQYTMSPEGTESILINNNPPPVFQKMSRKGDRVRQFKRN